LTELTFFSGVNEIGGNKILLEDKGTCVFLDFGESFSFGCDYFGGYLTPRKVNGVGDCLEFDLVPNLKGLYSREALKNTELKYCKPKFDAVILSHAHIDHIGHLHFLDPDIPVYCGEATKTIMDAMSESGGYSSGDHVWKTFRTGDKIEVDSLTLEPIHVDHSIPAAYGFIIHTSEGAIVYTGDMRLHGPMSKMTQAFIDRAAQAEPVAMISEGTRIAPKERQVNHTEEEVRRRSEKISASTSKLVIATYYGRDIDRFNTFHRISKATGRKFVISLKSAYLLNKLKGDPKLRIPEVLKDENILFYKKRKRSGLYDTRDYYQWERTFLDKAVTYKYVKRNQSTVLLNLDQPSFTELVDIRPDSGGHFIHSMSEPFTEEDIDAEIMHNWLRHFNLKFHQIHASGHCPKSDLEKAINTINPKSLYPIHTEYPELFSKIIKQQIRLNIPKRKITYMVK
jgi:ribonuclease J